MSTGQQPAQPGSGEVCLCHLKSCRVCRYKTDVDKATELRDYIHGLHNQLTAAQQRITELESDLENERARGIHTCHDQCQRPRCVAQRRIAALESGLSEAIEIMARGERLLPKGEARFRLILEGKEPS